jgi:Zn-dependent protease
MKLGDMLFSVLKSLVGIKAAGVVGSVGLYTYLFTWQMAIALVVFIGIHEYGHLWAMRRCDIKTKGMFFIPGIGAVAVAEERFGSARNEAYIAIMGPIFGFVVFCLPMVTWYMHTKEPIYAAIASLMAFVNMINLLPVLPLDGGRMLKSITYSKYIVASLVGITVVSVATAVLGAFAGFTLVGIMALVGAFEIAGEFGITTQTQNFLRTIARAIFPSMLGLLAAASFAGMTASGIFWGSVFGILLITLICLDIGTTTHKHRYSVWRYPQAVVKEALGGIREVLSIRSHDVKPIPLYEPMSAMARVWYVTVFLAVVAAHGALIIFLSQVPGAEIAAELLK